MALVQIGEAVAKLSLLFGTAGGGIAGERGRFLGASFSFCQSLKPGDEALTLCTFPASTVALLIMASAMARSSIANGVSVDASSSSIRGSPCEEKHRLGTVERRKIVDLRTRRFISRMTMCFVL